MGKSQNQGRDRRKEHGFDSGEGLCAGPGRVLGKSLLGGLRLQKEHAGDFDWRRYGHYEGNQKSATLKVDKMRVPLLILPDTVSVPFRRLAQVGQPLDSVTSPPSAEDSPVSIGHVQVRCRKHTVTSPCPQTGSYGSRPHRSIDRHLILPLILGSTASIWPAPRPHLPVIHRLRV